jgi:hypothetical protein
MQLEELRDQFAIQILAALILREGRLEREQLCILAYRYADCMLMIRNKNI